MTELPAVWCRNRRLCQPIETGDAVFVMGVDFFRYGIVKRVAAAQCVMGTQHLIDVGDRQLLCVDFVLTRLPPNANLVLTLGHA